MKQTKDFSREKIRKLTLGAVLTALVILLQLMGSFIRLGPFSISLVLLPIVIGASKCGTGISTWLGLVFAFAVLISGDAAAFLAVSVGATVAVVVGKGVLAGLFTGLVYKALSKGNTYLAVVISAIVCPVVNTGVFLIGCATLFRDTMISWAGGENLLSYMVIGLVGANFIFELLFNIVLSPAVVRLLNIKKK